MPDRYQQIIDALKHSRRVLVTTHARPDGDALGSVTAMVLALRQGKIPAEVLLLTRLPRKYAFIMQENQITFQDADEGWPASLDLANFDTLLVLDTGTWSQLPGLREKTEGWGGRRIVVDHHKTQESWADLKLVVTEAAAAGEIVAELIEQWEIPLDKAIASALYLAIASDTGWFQFSNTRPYTLRLAALLMECGVDTDRIYQLIYQNEVPQRLVLQTRAQQSLELLEDGRLAVMCVTKEDFERAGAGVGDTENLINIPLQVRTVEVSILIVEPIQPGPIRISFRSKGSVDVAKFAETMGGGGHSRAAGLKLAGTAGDAKRRVVSAMQERLRAGHD